jgi:saccharopine dehydrogenase (NADP+, L-glutamate forming)
LRNQARFLQDGEVVTVEGPELMKSAKPIHIYPAFNVVGYANRDSSHYPQRYNMPECQTCLRGSLRYQVFPSFVQTLADLGFLSEEPKDYLSPDSPDITWRQVLANILNTTDDEQSLSQAILQKSPIESESEIERIFHGFKWLGLFSDINVTKRASNLLDTLCATLEQKMAYGENERDMVLLQHKFKVELADGTIQTRTSTLLEYGTPNGHSAMALTVGYPCGIATQLVLDGAINQKGILAPMSAEINQPLIEAIEKEGIGCIEETL